MIDIDKPHRLWAYPNSAFECVWYKTLWLGSMNKWFPCWLAHLVSRASKMRPNINQFKLKKYVYIYNIYIYYIIYTHTYIRQCIYYVYNSILLPIFLTAQVVRRGYHDPPEIKLDEKLGQTRKWPINYGHLYRGVSTARLHYPTPFVGEGIGTLKGVLDQQNKLDIADITNDTSSRFERFCLNIAHPQIIPNPTVTIR